MVRFLLVCLAMVVSSEQMSLADGKPRPNVLFIAVDDLNDWVGPLKGHPAVKTPHIDALAARGVTFLNAHCQAPLCNPSRTSLLLGLRPTTTGIYALEPSHFQLPAWQDHPSLFEHFKRAGYHTYSVGKVWHAGPGPRLRDRLFNEVGQAGKLVRPEQPFVTTPGRNRLVDWGPYPARDEDHYDFQTAAAMMAKLGSKPAEPFFAAVGFSLPHVPCYAPQKWFDLYPAEASLLPAVPDDDRDDVPRFAWYLHWRLPEPRLKFLREQNQWMPLVRAYLASISFMDEQVGRVLKTLEESGLAERTIVVLWSDHGWHLGEKGITGKNSLWERSTRVPLIFAGPGVAQNSTQSWPAELLDIYPTLCDLCDLAPPAHLEGHSLMPLLQGPEAPRLHPAITSHGPGNHAVRNQRWRYICYADGSEELYDMPADPQELTNLARQSQHDLTRRLLKAFIPEQIAPPAPGSKSRLIEFKDGVVYWETEPIAENATIPD